MEKHYKDLDKMTDAFNERFSEFMGGFPRSEKGRLETLSKQKEIDVMAEYLVTRPEDPDVSAKVKDIIYWT